MDYFSVSNEKLRKRFFLSGIFCGLIIFLVELAIFVLYMYFDKIYTSIPTYVVRNIIVPTLTQIAATLLCYLIIRNDSIHDKIRNRVVCIYMYSLTIIVMCTHYVFLPLYVAPGVAVFSSVFVGDKKFTRILYWLTYPFALLALYRHSIGYHSLTPDVIMGVAVAMAVNTSAYLVAVVLVKYHRDEAEYIYRNYKKNLELVGELKIEPLTRLLNRNALRENLFKYEKTITEDSKFCMAMIDVDNFKKANDTYGHIAGDEVLVRLAGIIKEYMNENIEGYRYGGEEFMIIFKNHSLDEAEVIIKKMLSLFSSQYYSFSTKKFTFSAGLCRMNMIRDYSERTCLDEFPGKQWTSEADKALYRAKNTGKNKVVVVDNGNLL